MSTFATRTAAQKRPAPSWTSRARSVLAKNSAITRTYVGVCSSKMSRAIELRVRMGVESLKTSLSRGLSVDGTSDTGGEKEMVV